jgi:hypothetical protein
VAQAVEDEAGRSWVLLMKTWQNVVSGEHRPTFVLENTGASLVFVQAAGCVWEEFGSVWPALLHGLAAIWGPGIFLPLHRSMLTAWPPPPPLHTPLCAADFVRANRLAQGDTLAFCPHHGRMLLRTSLRADQLPPRTLKRTGGAAAAGPAAKRRATSARPSPARSPAPGAWAPYEVLMPGYKPRAPRGDPRAPLTPEHPFSGASPAPAQLTTAGSGRDEMAAHALVTLHMAAGASRDSSQSEQAVQASRGGSPQMPAVLRPQAAHGGVDAASLLHALAPALQAAMAAAPPPPASLPPPDRQEATVMAAAARAGIAPEAAAQIHAMLAPLLAEREAERQRQLAAEQYSRALVTAQALLAQHQQREREAAAVAAAAQQAQQTQQTHQQAAAQAHIQALLQRCLAAAAAGNPSASLAGMLA